MDVDQLGAPVTAMALSHDGNCVLASCLDGRMRLLDKASGELLAQYTGEILLLYASAATMAKGLQATDRVSRHGLIELLTLQGTRWRLPKWTVL